MYAFDTTMYSPFGVKRCRTYKTAVLMALCVPRMLKYLKIISDTLGILHRGILEILCDVGRVQINYMHTTVHNKFL